MEEAAKLIVGGKAPPDWPRRHPSPPPEWSERGLSQLLCVDQTTDQGGTLDWFSTLGLHSVLCLGTPGICSLLVFPAVSICSLSVPRIGGNASPCIESDCQCASLLIADQNLLGEYLLCSSMLSFSGHLVLVRGSVAAQ